MVPETAATLVMDKNELVYLKEYRRLRVVARRQTQAARVDELHGRRRDGRDHLGFANITVRSRC